MGSTKFVKLALPLFVIAATSCSTTNLTVDMTSSAIKEGVGTFFEESDYDLARRGMESNIKLLEVFYKASPVNRNIRVLLAEVYGGYSYVFLDTDLLYEKNPVAAKKISARISNFYSRGMNYGLSILKQDELFKKAIDKNDMELFASATSRITDKEALFWTVFNWSLLVNMNRDSVDNVADIPRLHLLADRMVALDKDYFNGAPLALKAVIECSMPKMLGGKPDLGVKLMDQALDSAKRGMLITQLLYAQYCAPAVQNKKLFYSLTDEIDKANVDTIKSAILINTSVKMKAPVIKRSIKDIFLD